MFVKKCVISIMENSFIYTMMLKFFKIINIIIIIIITIDNDEW